MIQSVPICDLCNAQKKEVNRWFVAIPQPNGLLFLKWETAAATGLIYLPGAKHLCGQQCVHKVMDAFMSGEPRGVTNESEV